MKKKTVCFTGHREIPPERREELSRRLRDTLIQLIESGCLFFGAGGALGFDTLAAQAVLDLKRQYPQIKLILVLPCISQADRWEEKDRKIYAYIRIYKRESGQGRLYFFCVYARLYAQAQSAFGGSQRNLCLLFKKAVRRDGLYGGLCGAKRIKDHQPCRIVCFEISP